MAIGTGVAKQVIYKVQSGLGTKATAGSAQILRRVTSGLELKKGTFQSNEIRTDYQISDFRHGSKYVEGPINGELSPGTYKDFFAAALRKAFVSGVAASGVSLTITGTSAPYTLTRGAGSWLTDGFKNGDVIRLSVGSLHANNISKNLVIANISSATAMTVYPLNGSAMQAEGPIATTTITVIGKKTYVPTTGHTNLYYTIEQWQSDISVSESFLDCKVNTVDVSITPTGMSTCNFGFMGRNVDIAGSQYFTSPTAPTTSGVTAGANGLLLVDNATVANITGINFQINGNMSKEDVVGSNVTPDIFAGSVAVTGQITVLFENDTYLQMFEDETEASIIVTLTTNNTATAEFITFTIPRIKVGGNSRDDGQKGIVQTLPFTALFNGAGGTGVNSEQTTISIQDSLA
jgi:hypothetical protein